MEESKDKTQRSRLRQQAASSPSSTGAACGEAAQDTWLSTTPTPVWGCQLSVLSLMVTHRLRWRLSMSQAGLQRRDQVLGSCRPLL